MHQKRISGFRHRLLITIPLALFVVLAFPAPARALGDYIGVEAAPWFQGFEATGAIDGDTLSGTEFDFQDTLGLDDTDAVPSGRVWVRLFKKSSFIFDYAQSSRTGTDTLTSSLDFNDTSYAAGEFVSTDLDLNLLQAKYRYSFVDLKVVEVGFHLGLNLAQVDMQLDGSLNGLTTLVEDVPFPTVGGTVIVKPLPGFHIRAEIDGMGLSVSGNDVDIFDARFQIEYYFMHSFGIFAGYRTYSFDIVAEDFGTVNSSFDGAYAGLALKF
jgi:hypothetical protein